MNSHAEHILALDQGTTSSRALVFDRHGAVVAMAQQEFTQHFPQAGWVEHDAGEIWRTQLAVAREALARAGLQAQQLRALAITNQRETTVLWDRATGEPVAPAIVWQDRRTAAVCDALRPRWAARIQRKTGLVLDAYFSATKLQWLLDHVPGVRARAEAGEDVARLHGAIMRASRSPHGRRGCPLRPATRRSPPRAGRERLPLGCAIRWRPARRPSWRWWPRSRAGC